MFIAYDMDGTLIDSSEDILEALRIVLIKQGYQEIESVLHKQLIGPSIQKIVKEIMPDIGNDDIKKITQGFRQTYDNCDFKKTNLYPGIISTIKKVKKLGRTQFIVTNKPNLATSLISEKLNLKDYFKKIYTPDIQDNRLSKKEMLKMLISENSLTPEGIMIGDRAEDIIAAHEAGVIPIAVSWGYGKLENLKDAAPWRIVNSTEELYTAIVDCSYNI